MAEKLKYPGVPVYMNGRNYYIPSLSVRDFRTNYEVLTKPIVAAEDNAKAGLDAMDRFLPIIGLAIRRNYSEVTDGLLEDWLDLLTFKQAMRAVQDTSGLTAVTEGE